MRHVHWPFLKGCRSCHRQRLLPRPSFKIGSCQDPHQ